MKRPMYMLIISTMIFIFGCSFGGSKQKMGTAQSEEPPKSGHAPVTTIGDKFRTDLGTVTGLTVRGQEIKATTEAAIKAKNNTLQKSKPKSKSKKTK